MAKQATDPRVLLARRLLGARAAVEAVGREVALLPAADQGLVHEFAKLMQPPAPRAARAAADETAKPLTYGEAMTVTTGPLKPRKPKGKKTTPRAKASASDLDD